MLFSECHITLPEVNLAVTYTDEGPKNSAPAILFIHGFPFNKSMWDHQIEVLKEDYRVIAYDVRGHGNAIAGPDEFTITQFAIDLIRLMDDLGIESVTVCGLSMGGYIALQAMENFPSRFDALILCDTQCIADSQEGREKRMKTIESIRNYGKDTYAEESIKNLFAPESLNTKKEEVALIKEMIINTPVETLFSTLHALANRNETCSKLSDIRVPVMIMVGKEDKITPPSAARQMHESIKDSRLIIIENAGHLSNLENPDVFNEHMVKFVAEVYQ